MKKEIIAKVVGLTHHMDNYDEFCDNLAVGTRVYLIPEPSNLFDIYAIEVRMEDGKLVGRISQDESKQVTAGINETPAIGRVTYAHHKNFNIRVKVDAEAYENAKISTESRMIKTKLEDGVIGLRNTIPLLRSDALMIQAWSMIQTGIEDEDTELVDEGVEIFAQHYCCSLCAEDKVRAKWLVDNGYDKDKRIIEKIKDMTDIKLQHKVCMTQLEEMKSMTGEGMECFRERYNDANIGASTVEHWLDKVLDGQIKGCYNDMTAKMSSIIWYRGLSRSDLYTLFSHIVIVSKKSVKTVEIDEKEIADQNEKLKARLMNLLCRISFYIKDMADEEYKTALEDMFDLDKNDNFTPARHALWDLLTKPFPRDRKENGIDRIVVMNLVGKIKEQGYLDERYDYLAKVIYDCGNSQKDGKNIERAFDMKRYTPDIHDLVKHYFP